jgi:hypothetical protein
MKTHSIEWSSIGAPDSQVVLDPVKQLSKVMSLASRALLALVPALAIVVGAAWLITLPDLALFLQASIWAGGFIFLGLAIEAETAELSILNLATGIALPVLALLSSRAGLELVIVAATLVAAWVAAGILRR